jgi:hypothetical protein
MYGRLMNDEPRIILSLFPMEVDIASSVIMEHLVPAAKKLRIIELFAYLDGKDKAGGWASLNVMELQNCSRYAGNTLFIDMLFFIVRVFGRTVMILKQREASLLFGLVGCKMSSRITAFNDIVGKLSSTKRKTTQSEFNSNNFLVQVRTPKRTSRKANAKKSAIDGGDTSEELAMGLRNESPLDTLLGHTEFQDGLAKSSYEILKPVESDVEENSHTEDPIVKSLVKRCAMSENMSSKEIRDGESSIISDNIQHDVGSVKSLLESIRKDIDSRFSAWQIGENTGNVGKSIM